MEYKNTLHFFIHLNANCLINTCFQVCFNTQYWIIKKLSNISFCPIPYAMVINGEVDVDGIQLQLGRGRFQYLTFLVLGLIYSRGAWHVFGIIFLAGDPGHMCTLPLVSENRSDILQPSTFADNAHLKSHTRNNLLPAKELFTNPNSSDSGGLHERKSFDPSNTNNISDLQVDFGSSLPYSLQDGGKVEIRRNWTVYICDVHYVNQNGTSIALPDECPYGWTYGSLYDSTILSEVRTVILKTGVCNVYAYLQSAIHILYLNE